MTNVPVEASIRRQETDTAPFIRRFERTKDE